MNVAIIPARGGSKRIPRKNIRNFAGRPMLAYAIDAARQSGCFEHIVVSTDNTEIAAIANEWGAETPFMRPADLADDYTPTVPVIAHAVDACAAQGWSIDYACCIYPGVPLIEATDISRALEQLQLTPGALFSFPVAGFPSAIQRALKRNEDGRVQPFNPEYLNTRTQDLELAYFDAGQFYWGARNAWCSGQSIHANGTSITLPECRVVDIDTPEDWERAERLFHAFDADRPT